MNIALGFDKRYCKHAGATIQSIISNSKSMLNFYLLIDESVTNTDKYFLRYIIEKQNYSVNFIDMSKVFKDLYTGNWSKAMYYPILLSNLCNDSKILFLDSDVIVTEDLTEFYNTDINNQYCAAVHDCAMRSVINMNRKMKMSISKQKITMKEYFKNIRKWDENDIDKYFNSGMLLLNLDEIRKNKCLEEMLEILKTENLACPDQDCFNICFHEKVKIMPMNYNFMIIDKGLRDNLESKTGEIYNNYINNHKIPTIIHFLMKPWREKGILFEEEYYKYEKMLPLFFKITNINFNYKLLTKKIFSISNYYHEEYKDKILTIFGMEIRIKTDTIPKINIQ